MRRLAEPGALFFFVKPSHSGSLLAAILSLEYQLKKRERISSELLFVIPPLAIQTKAFA